jgi:hypothetical protein
MQKRTEPKREIFKTAFSRCVMMLQRRRLLVIQARKGGIQRRIQVRKDGRVWGEEEAYMRKMIEVVAADGMATVTENVEGEMLTHLKPQLVGMASAEVDSPKRPGLGPRTAQRVGNASKHQAPLAAICVQCLGATVMLHPKSVQPETGFAVVSMTQTTEVRMKKTPNGWQMTRLPRNRRRNTNILRRIFSAGRNSNVSASKLRLETLLLPPERMKMLSPRAHHHPNLRPWLPNPQVLFPQLIDMGLACLRMWKRNKLRIPRLPRSLSWSSRNPDSISFSKRTTFPHHCQWLSPTS